MVQFGRKNRSVLLTFIIALFLTACQEEPNSASSSKPSQTTQQKPKEPIKVPAFSSDSAYQYIVDQLAFGPRTNNSDAHKKCGDYFEKFFKDLGLTVHAQKGTVTAHDGKNLEFRNIIAQHNPEYGTRIFISAHWDSRPWADQDSKDKKKPIMAANDGASGVAVIMELARIITEQNANIGIDFILWDAEDYGVSGAENSFCYGSQHWANNKVPDNYRAKYGINLDMVGGTNASFPIEKFSSYYAPHIVKKVWKKAEKLGYQSYFIPQEGQYPTTDDHYYVNVNAGIPTIDIIHKDLSSDSFHPTWHTHDDNIDAIDKKTLQVVGEVVLNVIYDEVLR